MAICSFGGGVSGIRGTIAGVTYSASRAGPYCRAWARPTRRTTTPASLARSALGALAAEWRALSQANRDAWDVWAAAPAQARTNSLSETYYMSGFQAFCSISRNLDSAGRAHRSTPPTASATAAPTVSSCSVYPTGDASDSVIAYPANTFLLWDGLLFLTLIQGEGRSAITPPFPFLIHQGFTAGTSTTFQDELETVFGSVFVGQRAFYSLIRQHTQGLRSPPALGFVDVAATP